MKKFLSSIKQVSERIYDEIGCIEEKYLQVALSIELDKLKYLLENIIPSFL